MGRFDPNWTIRSRVYLYFDQETNKVNIWTRKRCSSGLPVFAFTSFILGDFRNPMRISLVISRGTSVSTFSSKFCANKFSALLIIVEGNFESSSYSSFLSLAQDSYLLNYPHLHFHHYTQYLNFSQCSGLQLKHTHCSISLLEKNTFSLKIIVEFCSICFYSRVLSHFRTFL